MAIFKSPRARAAREAGKRSSVEVARKLGLKTALEVDCLVEDIQPSQEWHHVGWKPRFGEPKRTYMFDADDIDRLLQKIAADPGALDRARERAIAKLENKTLTKKMADTDKIVFYEEVVRVTPKAILFKIKGRETWIGKYMIRSHNPREKTLVISAKVALEKNIEGYFEYFHTESEEKRKVTFKELINFKGTDIQLYDGETCELHYKLDDRNVSKFYRNLKGKVIYIIEEYFPSIRTQRVRTYTMEAGDKYYKHLVNESINVH